MATSCKDSINLPPFRASETFALLYPRSKLYLKSTISSKPLPIHHSGVSRISVSPEIDGTIGPTETFGYPNLPTKTPGGLDPAMDFKSNSGWCTAKKSALTCIAHFFSPDSLLTLRHIGQSFSGDETMSSRRDTPRPTEPTISVKA